MAKPKGELEGIRGTTKKDSYRRIARMIGEVGNIDEYALQESVDKDLKPWQMEFVLRLYIGGEAIRSIAEDMHITENTLKKALKQPQVIAYKKELNDMIQTQYESQMARITQASLDAMEELLLSEKNWREKVMIAKDVLKGVGLLSDEGKSGNNGVSINLNFNPDKTLKNVTAENKQITDDE